MDLFPDERLLREAGAPGGRLYFTLTTHRVRLKQQVLGRGELVSIMLDQITSCSVAQRSRPVLLGIAVLIFLTGFILAAQGASSVFSVCVIVAIILSGAYIATRRQVLELASAGATVRMNIKGMRAEVVEELIDVVEKAKHTRYLLR